MDLHYWGIFFSAALVINLSPGPDLIFIISKSINHNVKVGIASSMGIATGALIHVFAASIGISAILTSSELIFWFMKLLGSAFLIYLGVKQILQNSIQTGDIREDSSPSLWKSYKDGVLIDLLNPKVAIFFMVFLPQFTRAEDSPIGIQIFTLGLIVVLIGLAIEALIVTAISATKKSTLASDNFIKVANKLLGAFLIFIGINLVLFQ